jgi:low affinity Fe/Cu permease
MEENKPCGNKELFRRIACAVAERVGTCWAFGIALGLIALWAITGPLFHFSDTWQLVINTATTIVTFLMVFLIQNTQNRDAKAIHLKLDELIRSTSRARNSLVNLENLTDEDLAMLQKEFEHLQERAKSKEPATALETPKEMSELAEKLHKRNGNGAPKDFNAHAN